MPSPSPCRSRSSSCWRTSRNSRRICWCSTPSWSGALADEPLIFSHPVYHYLAERYGLDGISLHWEPDEAPSDKMWRELRDLLSDHPAKWVLWEDTPLVETSRRLAELGLGSVVFDPCANSPAQGDFLSVMRQNVENMKPVFASQ